MRRIMLSLLVLAVGHAPLCGQDSRETPGLTAHKPDTGRFVETPLGYMVPYKQTIPGTEIEFVMEPVPGGVFRMGSPPDEAGRQSSEGPTFTVEVPPFWMGKYEVRWAEYKYFMSLYATFKEFDTRKIRVVTDENRLDAITAPTELYEPSFTFEFGEDPQQPAVTITQYAAKQYTKWLSGITRQLYRLPSEAEWEYACRAGTTTAYSFGDDPARLSDYGWFDDNIPREGGQRIGQKKPNAWGLHDMHGNVAEWVLDELLDDGYQRFAGKRLSAEDALVWPQRSYPRVVRGGSWQDPAEACRSASRLGSQDEDWKSQDPNLPLSPWWYTSDPARGVGFRILRPLGDAPLDKQLRERYWKADAPDMVEDVQLRLDEGRGVLGLVDPQLPQAIRDLKNK